MSFETRRDLRIRRAVVTLCSLGMMAVTASQARDTGYPPPPGPYRVGPAEAASAPPVVPPAANRPATRWRVPNGYDAQTPYRAPAASTPTPLLDDRLQPPSSRPPAFVDRSTEVAPRAATAGTLYNDGQTTTDRPEWPVRTTQPAAPESVFRPAGTPPN